MLGGISYLSRDFGIFVVWTYQLWFKFKYYCYITICYNLPINYIGLRWTKFKLSEHKHMYKYLPNFIIINSNHIIWILMS